MQGKVVVITGASRGIGAAAARAFAQAGCRVALLARSQASVAALAAEIAGGIAGRAGEAGGVLALACDVADAGAVAAAVAQVVARFGRIDVMVNNAGVIEPIARLAEADADAFGAAIATNLNGVFHGMRAVLPVMRAQGSGTIITVSSGAAVNPLEGWGAYCASKAGALMLTRVAHVEEAAHGLRVLGLSPGTVATDMQVTIRQSGVNAVSRLDPSAHIPAEWAARALVWMCGPEADPWLGSDVSLREERVRRAVGLVA